MEAGRGWFAWILPGSAALHVLVVAVLPNSGRTPIVQAPVIIEMTEPPAPEPAPPPPPPSREEPAPERTPVAAPTLTRATLTAAPVRATNEVAAASERPADEAPVDFSSAVMSNDGPGMAIGSGRAAGPQATGPVAPALAPALAAPSGPRVVAAKDLSRPPRAPGLDVALERHYPADARHAGISGKAVLRVKILPDGRVDRVQRVEESRSGFGDACEKTVRGARWEPPIDREGTPVATEITYTCRFEIRD
jgi:protein TonB